MRAQTSRESDFRRSRWPGSSAWFVSFFALWVGISDLRYIVALIRACSARPLPGIALARSAAQTEFLSFLLKSTAALATRT